MGAPLTRDQILHAPDLPTERVAVPEWGGDVLIRVMSADDRDSFEALTYESRGGNVRTNLRGLRARLLSFCLVGEDGERLFTEAQMGELGRKSSVPMDRLWAIARRVNAMDQRDVDELAGNSEPGPPGAPPSGSPSGSAA